jgi:hypothetical protein
LARPKKLDGTLAILRTKVANWKPILIGDLWFHHANLKIKMNARPYAEVEFFVGGAAA